ncbi:hypothetical protein PspLS_02959 [Pyricularia sp. CBS 133598]|nr:hypothetical protein PspLS_02959 [Pyricularia sp. CBS 133598]
MKSAAFLAALGSAGTVLAHGHVDYIIVEGVQYPGYDVTKYPWQSQQPTVVGWSATNTDNGFVEPNNFGSPDIICHRGAQPAKGHARVKAGDRILLQWDTWPESHHGPVIDYLARCSGNCETVDKTSLRFFKIGAGTYISGSPPGYWASDELIKNGFSWVVQIPASIAPGNYVLRHEIIALHGAPNANGAQAYPQCFNLEITGSGSTQPAGVAGTSLYRANDPGILFQLYQAPISYRVPGPPMMAGVPTTVSQYKMVATATSAPFTPGGGNQPNPPPSQPPPPPNPEPTTPSPEPTTPPGNGGGNCASLYGQCGGNGWGGATCCTSGTCRATNEWYSQCLP